MKSNGNRQAPPPPRELNIMNGSKYQTAPLQTSQSTNPPSLLRTMSEGFCFGAGSAIARTAVASIASSISEVSDKKESDTSDKCSILLEDLNKCIIESNSNCDVLLTKYTFECIN